MSSHARFNDVNPLLFYFNVLERLEIVDTEKVAIQVYRQSTFKNSSLVNSDFQDSKDEIDLIEALANSTKDNGADAIAHISKREKLHAIKIIELIADNASLVDTHLYLKKQLSKIDYYLERLDEKCSEYQQLLPVLQSLEGLKKYINNAYRVFLTDFEKIKAESELLVNTKAIWNGSITLLVSLFKAVMNTLVLKGNVPLLQCAHPVLKQIILTCFWEGAPGVTFTPDSIDKALQREAKKDTVKIVIGNESEQTK